MDLYDRMRSTVVSIHWFQSCGQPPQFSIPLETCQLTSWADVDAVYDADWESLKRQRKNALTSSLAVRYQDQLNEWNSLLANVRNGVTSFCLGALSEAAESHGLAAYYVDEIRDDVELALMEAIYFSRGCRTPVFFGHLLTVYLGGHFPCGWSDGEYPEGFLVFY